MARVIGDTSYATIRVVVLGRSCRDLAERVADLVTRSGGHIVEHDDAARSADQGVTVVRLVVRRDGFNLDGFEPSLRVLQRQGTIDRYWLARATAPEARLTGGATIRPLQPAHLGLPDVPSPKHSSPYVEDPSPTSFTKRVRAETWAWANGPWPMRAVVATLTFIVIAAIVEVFTALGLPIGDRVGDIGDRLGDIGDRLRNPGAADNLVPPADRPGG